MKSKTSLIALYIITSFCLCAIFVGCDGGAGTFIGGAATGAAASNTIAGLQADLDKQRQILLDEQAEILARLENTNDSVERAALEAENAALKKRLELIASASTGVDITEKAIETDWTDLNQSAPWINSVVMALLLYLTDRKKRNISQILTAVNEGVEKYKAVSQPDEAQKLYKTIKERKQINGVK